MKRYRIDFSYGRYFFDERVDGDWVRFEDHEAVLEAAHRAQREAETETGRALAAHAIEAAQLRGTLSLAEEGLANYAQENERLRVASTRLIVAMRRDNWPGKDHGYVRELAALVRMPAEPQTAEHGEKHE